MIAPADLAACQALLADGSRTFLAASRLLPRGVRDAACALYAFCRLADDAVDLCAAATARDAIGPIRDRLDALCAGRPADHAADRALAAVVRDHAIDRALLEALIEGFAWDAEGRRFETIDALHDYAARVAGSVGAMMALLMGVRDPVALARACDLGVAMQLSNIARDVGEDARRGRLYLPAAWLRDAGLDPDAWLADPHFDPALAVVVGRLLDDADVLYARVGSGVARLPLACRPGINVARRLYAAIGHEVARRGADVAFRERVVVSTSRKMRLFVVAALGGVWSRAPATAAHGPLPATAFLVEAGLRRAPPPRVTRSRWNVGARAAWTLELFERLEREDLRSRARPGGAC